MSDVAASSLITWIGLVSIAMASCTPTPMMMPPLLSLTLVLVLLVQPRRFFMVKPHRPRPRAARRAATGLLTLMSGS